MNLFVDDRNNRAGSSALFFVALLIYDFQNYECEHGTITCPLICYHHLLQVNMVVFSRVVFK